jgi:hypothetical protein
MPSGSITRTSSGSLESLASVSGGAYTAPRMPGRVITVKRREKLG